jgi:hypothetical protein
MTAEKIKHYIGEQVFNHICSLDKDNLEKMKRNIISDINNIRHDSKTLFNRTIELEFIKNRLS